MYTVLLVIHLMIAVALIGLILFQRSSSDGLGSLSGGGNNVMSGRTQANLLTRTTAILATLFILASLALGVLIKKERAQTFGAALEASQIPTPVEDMKDKADEAADKKAVKDAGGTPAPVIDESAKKTAPAKTPAAPAVPKGE